MHAWPWSPVHPCVSTYPPHPSRCRHPSASVPALEGNRVIAALGSLSMHIQQYTHTQTHTLHSCHPYPPHTPHSIFTLHTHHSTPARQHTRSSLNIHHTHTHTHNMCTHLTCTPTLHAFTCPLVHTPHISPHIMCT